MKEECKLCSQMKRITPKGKLVNLKGELYCNDCAKKVIDLSIKMTTTQNIDGYRVKCYIGVESVEIVMGTGFISEFATEWQDVFGARSTDFEIKLQKAKETAISKLKYLTFEKGGDAIIGTDIDYTEFSGNRIGLIVNGTIVELERIDKI